MNGNRNGLESNLPPRLGRVYAFLPESLQRSVLCLCQRRRLELERILAVRAQEHSDEDEDHPTGAGLATFVGALLEASERETSIAYACLSALDCAALDEVNDLFGSAVVSPELVGVFAIIFVATAIRLATLNPAQRRAENQVLDSASGIVTEALTMLGDYDRPGVDACLALGAAFREIHDQMLDRERRWRPEEEPLDLFA